VILTFADTTTEDVFNGVDSKAARRIDRRVWARAREVLDALNWAISLEDLRTPPSRRLHPLTQDRAGQHSVSVNMQYRICFHWTDAGPEDVEIVDYH
jgi:proteic killer suppression protein